MSDTLSGGRIDASTDGPLPPKEDIRNTDILATQRQRQSENSAGGIGPVLASDPEIPEAPRISSPPPLPEFNFDFASIQPIKPDEIAREAARQEVFDVLKNVTINGQTPIIQGLSISFDIPTEQSASDAFVAQNFPIQQNTQQTSIAQMRPEGLVGAEKTDEIKFKIDQPNVPTIEFKNQESGIFENIQDEYNPFVEPYSSNTEQVQDAYQHNENIRAQISEGSFNTPIQMELVSDRNAKLTNEESNSIVDFNKFSHIRPIDFQIDNTETQNLSNSQIRDIAASMGGQTTQRYWSNYIDPKEIREVEFKKPSQDLNTSENYRRANEPFPPLQKFRICINGEPMIFLIPAFGPYPDLS